MDYKAEILKIIGCCLEKNGIHTIKDIAGRQWMMC